MRFSPATVIVCRVQRLDTPSEQNVTPKVFVSYAHETSEHKKWVKSLAADLRTRGIDALLDDWQVDLGEDFTLFMDKIRQCDRVLLICTPAYARKSNEGEGGVGYERSIITAELAKKIATSKFLCVLRTGNPGESIPIFAEARRYIDFRDDADYDVRSDELLQSLHNAPRDPEPPIGENLSRRVQQVESDTGTSLSSESRTDEIIRQAESILSRKDMIGWKRLLRRARQDVAPDLIEWRNQLDPAAQNNEESWLSTIDEAVGVAEPLFVLALSAVESEIPSISDQSALIDDLLHLEGWDPNGACSVVYIPAALGFLYHHLLGTFLLESSRREDAIRLLTRSVRTRNETSVEALWQNHELMGWVKSLDGNCITSWNFMRSLWPTKPWLATFFTSERSFFDSYRAYAALASCIELAAFLGKGATVGNLDQDLWLDVPPTFVHPVDDNGTDIAEIMRRAIPNNDILNCVITMGKCEEVAFRESWPIWYKHWMRFNSRCYRVLGHCLVREEAPPLPDL